MSQHPLRTLIETCDAAISRRAFKRATGSSPEAYRAAAAASRD